MRKCPSCGNNNEENHSSCVHCGESLQKRGGGNNSSRKNKSIIMIIAVIGIVIAAVIGYQTLTKKYSEEATVDQFLSALTDQDKDTMKKLIVPKDSRIKITSDSLQSLFELIEKSPSVYQDIENSLTKESLADEFFTVRQDGKVYGLFSKYVIDPIGYVIEIQTVGEETLITLNDSELGFISEAGESAEYGPFMSGIYQLKSTTMIEGEEVEEEVELALLGVQSKVALKFAKAEAVKEQNLAVKEQAQKEAAEKEEAQKKAEKAESEKVIVKEVIREVPVGGNYYYIIPHSDYAYLTKPDLAGLSKGDLRIARNEIYARHGRTFQSKDLQNYFNSQDWYYPDPSYKEKLSAVEKHNVDLIKSLE